MTVKDLAERAASQAASFFEKATEIRFFLHVLCVALYLDIGTFIIFDRTMFSLDWADIERIPPGKILALFIGYFLLMGYIFRLIYAFVSYSLRWLHLWHASINEVHPRTLRGWVHKSELIQRSYERKDGDLLRQIELRREQCRQDHQETRELAYLGFAALLFILLSKLLNINGLLYEAKYFVATGLSQDASHALEIFLTLPLFFLVWIDAKDDYTRDEYIEHLPIYLEVKEKEEKKRLKE